MVDPAAQPRGVVDVLLDVASRVDHGCLATRPECRR
jgi:hypothetical protein